MEWNEYKELSEKTLSTEFFHDDKVDRLLHAVVGVITELEELIEWGTDKVGKSEEIIDIFWYLAIIGREYDMELPDQKCVEESFIYSEDKNILMMFKNSAILLDFLKKKLYYNKEINVDVFKSTSLFLMSNVIKYSNDNNIDIKRGFDTNIAKLKSRYGEKFSSERAINRDTDKEREILEQGTK